MANNATITHWRGWSSKWKTWRERGWKTWRKGKYIVQWSNKLMKACKCKWKYYTRIIKVKETWLDVLCSNRINQQFLACFPPTIVALPTKTLILWLCFKIIHIWGCNILMYTCTSSHSKQFHHKTKFALYSRVT